MNSLGLSAGYAATFASAGISIAAEDKGDSQMGWGYDGGRLLSSIDFKRVGQEAAARACAMLGAGRAALGKVDLIIDNSVAGEFLSVVASMLSADNVQKKKSILSGVEGVVRPDCLIGFATSGIPRAHIAADATHPQRCFVNHPFFPAWRSTPIEVVLSPDDALSARMLDTLRRLGKIPIVTAESPQ